MGSSAASPLSPRIASAFRATNMPRRAASSAFCSNAPRCPPRIASGAGISRPCPNDRRPPILPCAPDAATRRSGSSTVARQIFGDDDRIELRHRAVRQPIPRLVAAEQSDAEIAAHGQRLTVRADPHHRAVDVAVARIENIAVVVFQAVALHVSDQRQPQQRLILAIVTAARTDRILRIVGPRKQFCNRAFVQASALLDEQKPADRIAGVAVGLLPQAGDRGLRGRRRMGDARPARSRTTADARPSLRATWSSALPRVLSIRRSRNKSLPGIDGGDLLLVRQCGDLRTRP